MTIPLFPTYSHIENLFAMFMKLKVLSFVVASGVLKRYFQTISWRILRLLSLGSALIHENHPIPAPYALAQSYQTLRLVFIWLHPATQTSCHKPCCTLSN